MAFPYSSGDVLTAADLNDSSGLVLLRSVTPGTSVSSVTVSNVFNNDFRNYKIQYYGGSASTLAALNMQLGSKTTGYYWAYRYLAYSTGGQFTNNGNNVTNFTNVGEISTTNGNMMDCTVFGPNIAKPTGITWQGSFQSVYLFGAGREGSSAQHTSFTLFPSSGTFSAGLLQVYGYNAA